jgi:hypothetical protein
MWIIVACRGDEKQARRAAVSSKDKRSMITSYAERKESALNR